MYDFSSIYSSPPLILLPYKYASNLMKYLTAGASITVLVIQAGWFVWFLNDNNRNSVPDCNCILSKPLYFFAYGFYSQDKENKTICFVLLKIKWFLENIMQVHLCHHKSSKNQYNLASI